MAELPSRWWDQVLDGTVYLVDLRSTPYDNLTALRSAAYREANMRQRLAATSARGVFGMLIQAWGNPDVPGMQFGLPRLTRSTEPGTPAPDPRTFRPVPPPRPIPASRPAPQAPAASTQEPDLTEAEIEALLGPCTCGQEPICLPSCARA